MYLINIEFHKTKSGGYWNCKVFISEENNIYNISGGFAALNDLEFITKGYDGYIKIKHGCGTAYSILAELLRKTYTDGNNTKDISIN